MMQVVNHTPTGPLMLRDDESELLMYEMPFT